MLAEVPASNSVLNYSDASNYTPKKAVDKLVSSNINFLAIDFDVKFFFFLFFIYIESLILLLAFSLFLILQPLIL